MPKYVKSIEKVDDLTVKFVLNEPNAPMIANLAMDFASIVSKEYADKLVAAGTPQLLSTQPIGTGPFQFVDYQLDAVIRYAAFPDYWGGKRQDRRPDLRHHARTPAVRAQKLKAGECDIMPYPAPADIAGLQEDPNLTVMEQEGLNIGYMAYNITEAPFDNVEGPQGADDGDQQAGDHRSRVPGRRPGGQEPDPADDVVVQRRGRRRHLRSGSAPRRCWRKPA